MMKYAEIVYVITPPNFWDNHHGSLSGSVQPEGSEQQASINNAQIHGWLCHYVLWDPLRPFEPPRPAVRQHTESFRDRMDRSE